MQDEQTEVKKSRNVPIGIFIFKIWYLYFMPLAFAIILLHYAASYKATLHSFQQYPILSEGFSVRFWSICIIELLLYSFFWFWAYNVCKKLVQKIPKANIEALIFVWVFYIFGLVDSLVLQKLQTLSYGYSFEANSIWSYLLTTNQMDTTHLYGLFTKLIVVFIWVWYFKYSKQTREIFG